MERLILLIIIISFLNPINGQTQKFANVGAPYNNINKDGVGVQGYDLVSYFLEDLPSKGSEKHSVIYQGVAYWFSNLKNKELFNENPEYYLPQYGGYCATGLGMDVGLNGELPGKYPINPKTYKIIDNKLYLFYNDNGVNAMLYWEEDENHFLKKANERWHEINTN